MKLAEWLTHARACAMTTLRVQSPRGHELLRGALTAFDAEAVEERCKEDAAELSAESRHEYVVIVEGESGSMDRFSVRVAGGKRKPGEADAHVVEPERVNTAAQINGHLLRALVDVVKSHTALAMKVAEGETEAGKELRRTQRTAFKAIEAETVRDMVKFEHERASKGGVSDLLLKEGLDFGKLALSKFLPAAASATLDQFRETLTPEQLDKLDALLGTKVVRSLLAATTPDAFVKVAMGIDPAVFQQVMGELSDHQQKLLTGAIAAAYERAMKAMQDAEAKAAAAKEKPAAPSTANGAAS